jgi:SagB-type dehydrogenase family enzyme
LAAVLDARRSIRRFAARPLSLAEAGQLLWAAQGMTTADGHRTAPSAGALFPLELRLVAGEVEGLPDGLYRYAPREHALDAIEAGDRREALSGAAFWQECVLGAPAIVAVSAVYQRTTVKYADRGVRYAHMEAGHAAQNLCLQAVGLGLGAVVVGAFSDREVSAVLGLASGEEPLCLVPVGRA